MAVRLAGHADAQTLRDEAAQTRENAHAEAERLNAEAIEQLEHAHGLGLKVLVTGGTGGIGKPTATGLAARGAGLPGLSRGTS